MQTSYGTSRNLGEEKSREQTIGWTARDPDFDV